MRTLFIGEDCDQHVTCMGWAYNVDTKVLRRTLTAPVAAELTGSASAFLTSEPATCQLNRPSLPPFPPSLPPSPY